MEENTNIVRIKPDYTKLTEIRERRKLTKQAAAEYLGLAFKTYDNLEEGKLTRRSQQVFLVGAILELEKCPARVKACRKPLHAE